MGDRVQELIDLAETNGSVGVRTVVLIDPQSRAKRREIHEKALEVLWCSSERTRRAMAGSPAPHYRGQISI